MTDKVLEVLRKIDPNFQEDFLGYGYGVRSENEEFIRIKPFWISKKELEEKGVGNG